MKKLYLFLLLLALPLANLAQDPMIKRANQEYDAFSFKPAQDIYKRVLEKGYVSAEVLQKLGDTHYFNAEYDMAAEVYGRLVTEYPHDAGPAYYFRYAQALKSREDYSGAARAMKTFYTLTGRDSSGIAYDTPGDYMAAIQANSGRYELVNFPYNSEYLEFAPSYYGSDLLFSSDRDTGNLARYRHTWNARDFMDIYQVRADSTSGPSIEKVAGVNTRWHESTSALSPD